jgi:catechol 2,3-dioxygenase-like lactoylglutathione lyase family enzyme
MPPGVLEPFREINLLVSDVEKSIDFYCATLGMSVSGSDRTDDISRVHVHVSCECTSLES